MYVKLFASILHSSIWAEDAATRLVWITLLAMADRNGHVRASVSGLARAANVTPDECRRAVVVLEGPDPESGSPEFDGRRIEPVEGGWNLLNYAKYREIRTDEQLKAAARQRAFYNREKRKASRTSRESKRTSRTEAEAATETETTFPQAGAVIKRNHGWVSEALRIWSAAQGEVKPGRMGGALKIVVNTHGHTEVLRRFRIFANGKDARFGLEYFASHFQAYAAPAPGDFNPADYSVGTP